MKKIKVVVCTLLAFLFSTPLAYAECDASESNKLSSLANNVNTSQEVIKKEIPLDDSFSLPDGLTEEEIAEYKATRDYFRIYITNITEDLYVTVTNRNTKETKAYNYSDSENGTIYFDELVFIDIVNYTIEVYSSNNTGCPGKKLRTLYVTTPRYNTYSEYALCDGIEEFYLCHEYLSVETSFENFEKLARQYRDNKLKEEEKKKEKKEKGFLEFLKEHKGVVIIVSVVIIATGGLVTVIIVKKQRSRVV